MRKIILLTAALSFTLTACGEGSSFDEGFKKSYREKLVTACVSSAKGSIPAGVNVDLNGICGCATDKIMEGKSTKQLMEAASNGATPEDQAKMQECMKQFPPTMGGAPVAPAAPATK